MINYYITLTTAKAISHVKISVVKVFDKFRQNSLVKIALSRYVKFMLRRKLLINLLIVLVCGTVAVSLPIIVNNLQKSRDIVAQTEDWQLVSIYVGNQYKNLRDNYNIWQIELRHGDKVIPWSEIFATIQNDPTKVDYDTTQLRLLENGDGFVYLTKTTAAAVVTYQNKSCLLQ